MSIIEQVAAALDAAHETGLIHRDVKPSNILITDRDFAYLIDFGLARTAGDAGLTTAGSTFGTMAYMSPERFEGGHIDVRADVYALTCVLYECLTGSRPYPVDSLEQQIARHIGAPVPKPSAIDPKLAPFDEVIAKGMDKKPERRYQTAGEMAAAARQALSMPVGTTGGAGRHSAGRVKKRPRRGVSGRALAIAGAAVLLVAALAFGGWQLFGGRGGGGSAGPTDTSTPSGPAEATDGVCAGDRGVGARRHQVDGPAGGRGECALRAKRIQELLGRDRRLRRRPDERGGQNNGTGDRVSGDDLRGHHSRGAER